MPTVSTWTLRYIRYLSRHSERKKSIIANKEESKLKFIIIEYKNTFLYNKSYERNVGALSRFVYWSSNLRYNVIQRWGLWEVIRCWRWVGSVMGLVSSYREQKRAELSLHHVRPHWEGGSCLQGRKRDLAVKEMAGTLILDFIGSRSMRSMRNKCLLPKPPSSLSRVRQQTTCS